MMDTKTQEPVNVLIELAKDLDMIHNFLQILVKDPARISKELLQKAAIKVGTMAKKVQESITLPKENRDVTQTPPEICESPVEMIEDVTRRFHHKIDTKVVVQEDVFGCLGISNPDFRYLLKSMIVNSIHNKTNQTTLKCEIFLASSGGELVMKYKDFNDCQDIKEIKDAWEFGHNPGFSVYKIRKMILDAGGRIRVQNMGNKLLEYVFFIPYDITTRKVSQQTPTEQRL